MQPDAIKETLEKAIPESRVEVEDLTGGGDHFKVTIVAAAFEGLGQVQRHQLVYKALEVASTEAIHALSLKTYTVDEWAKRQ